jgi:hypothetical protein
MNEIVSSQEFEEGIIFRLDIEPDDSDEELMPDFPRRPAHPVAPAKDATREELDRKLAAYLERAPDEQVEVQKMFTRVIQEIADVKRHVDNSNEEIREDLRGVKARVGMLEIGHKKLIEEKTTSFVREHLSDRPVARSNEDLGNFGEYTPAGGIKIRPEDIAYLSRKFSNQEAERRGAEEAVTRLQEEAERKAHEVDRLWKRAAIVGSALVTLCSALVYLLTHILHL